MRAVVAPFALAAFALAPLARAENPSVNECLSATETSLHLRGEQKLRAARAQLLVCSAESCPAEVRDECLHRTALLNEAQPTVVFTVKDRVGQERSAVKVTMDGEVVATHLDGTALPLDPGSHVFTFETDGSLPATETIVLHEGEKDRGETVVVDLVAPTPGPSTDRGHSRRISAFAVGGVGIAGLLTGAAFGIAATASWNIAKGECPTYKECSGPAINERNLASSLATVSTVGLVAGGVFLAGGLTLYFTAPKNSATRVGLSWNAPAGLSLTGRF